MVGVPPCVTPTVLFALRHSVTKCGAYAEGNEPRKTFRALGFPLQTDLGTAPAHCVLRGLVIRVYALPHSQDVTPSADPPAIKAQGARAALVRGPAEAVHRDPRRNVCT